MSRYWCDWYQICVPHPDDNIRNDGKNKELSIYLGIRDGRRHDIKLDSLSYPEELIKAFRFSNRLIE